eukprot:TRINITY_DN6614_c0_g1_i1.p1 TRINITY_DN6614_c0_g1~~TRINITY_DN6614_c0_g1_i1.p1  ORF type:complete len:632 (+),score=143.30 TRINITY_DN6614_c0_g1_i1:59-1954(+)
MMVVLPRHRLPVALLVVLQCAPRVCVGLQDLVGPYVSAVTPEGSTVPTRLDAKPSKPAGLVLEIEAASQGGSFSQVYSATDKAAKLAEYGRQRKQALNAEHAAERQRILEALEKATTAEDKALLEFAAQANEEARLQAVAALNHLVHFASSVKQAMGSQSGAASCKELSCGSNAVCVMPPSQGARCVCKDGFAGDGFACNPVRQPVPHPLFAVRPHEPAPQVADVHVAAFGGDGVGIVYRDVERSHRGYLLLGQARDDGIHWMPSVCFSDSSQAFAPQLVELLDEPGFAIAFRTRNRGGVGQLLGGTVDKKAAGRVHFGQPAAFARNQAQTMSLMAFPQGRVGVLYSEHLLEGLSGKISGGSSYGAALLATVRPSTGHAPEIVNKVRFMSGHVARISAVQLSPTSFVVAYRHAEDHHSASFVDLQGVQGSEAAGKDDAAAGRTTGAKTEASCLVGELRGDHFAFTAHALSLEPDMTQIWARSVALVQENVIAYTYHSGNEEATKEAIIRLDPATHRLNVLQKQVLAKGFTPTLGSISSAAVQAGSSTPVVAQEHGPRLLTYYGGEPAGGLQMRLCKVSAEGLPSSCARLPLLKSEVLSASVARMSDDRAFLLYTDARGTPFYKLVGLQESE